MKSIGDILEEAYAERQAPDYLEKVSMVGSCELVLYSRDGEHWASSVDEISRWERARERRQAKVWGDHRAAFNPAVSGRRKKTED